MPTLWVKRSKTQSKPSPHFPQEQRELEMTRLASVYLNVNLISLVVDQNGDTSSFQWTFVEPYARHHGGC